MPDRFFHWFVVGWLFALTASQIRHRFRDWRTEQDLEEIAELLDEIKEEVALLKQRTA